MPDTTVRVEYIGAVQNFSEVTITGNQQVWRIGSSAFVETGRASQLVASGKFRSLANDPAMLPSTQSKIGVTSSDGGIEFYANGVRAGIGYRKNIAEFGVLPDGNDQTANFSAAIASGFPLLVPRGTYKINGAVSNTVTSAIDIVCEAGVLFDGSASVAPMLITIGGAAVGSPITLGADAVKGTTAIVVPGNTYSVGDTIRLVSTDLWNPANANYIRGEMGVVVAVAGDNVTLRAPLYDTYTAATTKAVKLSMPTCRIDGLKIVRAGGEVGGLQIQYAKNVNLTALDVRGCDERGIYMLQCFGAKIDGCSANGAFYTGTGTAYGLCIASCQSLLVTGGEYVGGRHGIAVGGTFPNRHIRFYSPVVDNDASSDMPSMDSHGNAEFVEWINCHVHNGALLQAINCRVIGGEYRTKSFATGALVMAPEIGCDYIEVLNVFAANFAGRTGVWIAAYTTGKSFGRLLLQNVTTRSISSSTYGSASIAVGCYNPSHSMTIDNLVVTGCDARFAADNSAIVYGLGVGMAGTVTCNRAVLYGNYIGGGYNKTRSLYVNVIGTVISEKNVYIGGDSANYSAIIANGNFYSMFDTFDGVSASQYVYATTTGKFKMLDGVLKNLTGSGGLSITASTDVQLRNIDKSTSAGSFSVAATYAYTDKSSAGTVVMYRNAVPSLYTWAVGDRCINTAPAVGSPKAWSCTVAGTPGTWVSEGNL